MNFHSLLLVALISMGSAGAKAQKTSSVAVSPCGNVPEVGDEVDFTLSETVGKSTSSGALAVKTIDVKGDSTSGSVTQDYIRTNQSGVVVSSSEQLATIQDLEALANGLPSARSCAADGGKLDSVRTPTKTYRSCRITQPIANGQATVWIARVLGGIVKSVKTTTLNGIQDSVTLVLAAQKFGACTTPQSAPPPTQGPAPAPPFGGLCNDNSGCAPDYQCMNGQCQPETQAYRCDDGVHTCSPGNQCNTATGYCE